MTYTQNRWWILKFEIFHKNVDEFWNISDLQLLPSRTDDYIPKLFYETNKFNAFDQFWVLRAKIIGNETNANRGLQYQLSLKGSIWYYYFVKPVFVKFFFFISWKSNQRNWLQRVLFKIVSLVGCGKLSYKNCPYSWFMANCLMKIVLFIYLLMHIWTVWACWYACRHTFLFV